MNIQNAGFLRNQRAEGFFVEGGFAVVENSHGSLLGKMVREFHRKLLYPKKTKNGRGKINCSLSGFARSGQWTIDSGQLWYFLRK